LIFNFSFEFSGRREVRCDFEKKEEFPWAVFGSIGIERRRIMLLKSLKWIFRDAGVEFVESRAV